MAREVILYGTRRREYFSKTRLRTFFFRDHPDFGRKIGKSEMKSKWRPFFFFREHPDFGRKIGKSKWRHRQASVYFDIEFHNLEHWKENVADPCTILSKIVRHAQLTKFKNWHTALKRLPTPALGHSNSKRLSLTGTMPIAVAIKTDLVSLEARN